MYGRRVIRNFDELAVSPGRRLVLGVAEAGLQSIQPDAVMQEKLELSGGSLRVKGDSVYEADINSYQNVNMLAFGKGSEKVAKYVARQLRTKLKAGYVIDSVEQDPEDNRRYPNLKIVQGSHPTPSKANADFTREAVEALYGTEGKELTLFVVCGGGSSMLVSPYKMDLEKKVALTKSLLSSGADISEVNTVRKHVSEVKGGQLASRLYRKDRDMVAMMFSDVPTSYDSKEFLASGPTVPDGTTNADAVGILRKYGIADRLKIYEPDLKETPKGGRRFENVRNVTLLTNQHPLSEMAKAARAAGALPIVYRCRMGGEARRAGRELLEKAREVRGTSGSPVVLLAGGETTVKVTGKGRGGRNQEAVLAALPYLKGGEVVSSFSSDGWDFEKYAGAIGDSSTLEAMPPGMSVDRYLEDNDSGGFFDATGDGIDTGRLSMNLADFFVAYVP